MIKETVGISSASAIVLAPLEIFEQVILVSVFGAVLGSYIRFKPTVSRKHPYLALIKDSLSFVLKASSSVVVAVLFSPLVYEWLTEDFGYSTDYETNLFLSIHLTVSLCCYPVMEVVAKQAVGLYEKFTSKGE